MVYFKSIRYLVEAILKILFLEFFSLQLVHSNVLVHGVAFSIQSIP
jgi:hypothetical protein